MRGLMAVFVLLSSTGAACAWGEEGHSIVAEVAQHRLSPAAQSGVSALFVSGSLAALSSWADDERARDKTTTNWHFVDIPSSAAGYDASRDCKSNAALGDCIVAEIDREKKVVACESVDQQSRVRSLKFLVHFLGDLHQPLHAVEDAHGGNEIDVTVVSRQGINGNAPFNTSLHSAWDAALIQKTTWSWGSYVERLENGWLKTADTAKIEAGSVAEWAEQTHKAAVRLPAEVPQNRVLDDAYRTRELPVLDESLAKGGIRLAKVLNDAFAAKNCN